MEVRMDKKTEVALVPEVIVANVEKEKGQVIGHLVATEDWWVTFDDGKAQIRKLLAAASIRPATFLPKSVTGGRLVMKLPDGRVVMAEKKANSPVILVKWEV
jgi:hypothetical protein